jgi:hypothetical protein
LVEHTAENRGVAGSIPALAISPWTDPEREKRRPGRCYRAADVAWWRILDGVASGGKNGDPGSRGQLLHVAEADLAEPGA